jgi:arginine deiminase
MSTQTAAGRSSGAGAQDEHDAFAAALRERGVDVLYLTDLLTETLADDTARDRAIETALGSLHLGETMRRWLGPMLHESSPEELTTHLTAGVRNDEVRGGFGLVTSLLPRHDFLIDPLPNLLFTRDSSVWVRDQVTITSLAMPARARETQLTELIYGAHPRFTGTPRLHGWRNEHVEGGDVLLLGPGVMAIGVGERTTPAGAEQLAREVFTAGLAHTVLAVPIAQERATMHLDTVCTMVDVDKVVMYPNVADTLKAYAVTQVGGSVGEDYLDLHVADAEHFRSPRRRRWRSTRSTRSTPASTPSPPSASSGTTATTPSPSPRGWPSRTSATTRRTPGSRTPASRSSGSPGPSSALAAAARAA